VAAGRRAARRLGPARAAAARLVRRRPAAPTHAERAALWRERLASPAAAADELAPALAARFAFTEGDVDAVLARAGLDAAWREREVDDALVWEAARRQPEHALERLAALVMPVFSLDDLVLAEETEVKLRELVAHVALQHVVLDEWGFRRRLPRGQGVAALFTGPPGTGKTTAAEAIARELGQDLYRIDLSAVVSKYVGETEKNLASAFDEAERGSAVLFFDEADALFGKRTEIRDAHDRYANLEVNYLLQRVETFTGLVVLASNRQSALDEAFLRRLRFVIRFDPPDARLRRELWERSFPAEARLGELDWDALATAELAGGSIQSAALSAAYLAATDGGVIGEEHVELALLREHQKLGKAWPGIRRGPARERAAAPHPDRGVRPARARPDPAAIAARLERPAVPGRARGRDREPGGARRPRSRPGPRRDGGAVALIKGILASFDNPLLGVVPTAIPFQYNPTELTRVFRTEGRRAVRRPVAPRAPL
jgi:AAA+ superfamily predicted ATPase